jgi:hypothetical protein
MAVTVAKRMAVVLIEQAMCQTLWIGDLPEMTDPPVGDTCLAPDAHLSG